MAARTVSRVFLDANVLMELFFSRPRKAKVEEIIMSLPEDALLTTSILSVHILFYYVEKNGFDKPVANAFLSSYKILDMNNSDYEWAVENDQNDFEDALQTACALRHGCRKIITLDQAFGARHKTHIPVILVR